MFRRESVESKYKKHGSVILAKPISFSILVFFIATITGLFFLYLHLTDYTKNTKVKGVLKATAGEYNLFAYKNGTAINLFFNEGDNVKKDDVVYNIKTDFDGIETPLSEDLESSINQDINIISNKIGYQETLTKNEKEAIEIALKDKDKEIKIIEEEIALKEERVKLIGSELSSMKKLLSSGNISQTDYNAKYSQQIEIRIDIKTSERRKQELLKNIDEAMVNLKTIDINGKSIIADYRQKINDLKRQLKRIKAEKLYAIKSPITGTVASVFYDQGHFVETSKPLMTILPENSELVAEIYIPSHSIGHVYAGQPINLRYQSFPYQKYGLHKGYIINISKTLIEPYQAAVETLIEEPSYRAVVKLKKQQAEAAGATFNLQSGMLLDADLIGEKRSMLAWLFSPLIDSMKNFEN